MKIQSTQLLTQGLAKVTLSDNTTILLAGEYAWQDGDNLVKLEHLNRERIKSGIQSESFEPGDFLNTMKRTNSTGRKMLYWNIDTLPAGITDEQAVRIIKWKDSRFNELMKPYLASTYWEDNRLGTEVFEAQKSENLLSIIKCNWTIANTEACNHVLGDYKPVKGKKNKYRGKQQIQTWELLEGLKKYLFVEGESVPGTGKTILFYFIAQEMLKRKNGPRVFVYFTDTINNTLQSLDKFAQYHSNDLKVMTNSIAVCSASPNDIRIRNNNAQLIHVSKGESEALTRTLDAIKTSSETFYLFVCYHSAEALLKTIDQIDGFPLMFRMDDEDDVLSEKHIDTPNCAVFRYQHLFSSGVGLSGTKVRRPQGNTNTDIVYNGDLQYGGPIVSVLGEGDARAYNQICDQKVLIMPVPENIRSLQRSNGIVELGISKINGKPVRVRSTPQMLLVQKAIEANCSKTFERKHIYVPFTRKADCRRALVFARAMQEVGLLSTKYKLIDGTYESGNAALEEFNNPNHCAILFGTRWINRGSDTSNCDAVIYTYVPSKKKFAAQTKGRSHRLSDVKEYALVTIIDFENELQENPLFQLIEQSVRGDGYEIIGEDIDLNFNIEDDGVIDGANRRQFTQEQINERELFLMRGEDSNPEWFEQWQTVISDVSAQLYTDAEGNTTFTHLVLRVRIKAAEEFKNRCLAEGMTLEEAYQKWMYKCEGKIGKRGLQKYTTTDYAFFNNSKKMDLIYKIFEREDTKRIKDMSDDELVDLYIDLRDKNIVNELFAKIRNAVYSTRKLSKHPKMQESNIKKPLEFYHYEITKDGKGAVLVGKFANALAYEKKVFKQGNNIVNRTLLKNKDRINGFATTKKQHIFIPTTNEKFKPKKQITL